jgi:hypothetical protein
LLLQGVATSDGPVDKVHQGVKAYRGYPFIQIGVELPFGAVVVLENVFVVELGEGDARITVEVVDGSREWSNLDEIGHVVVE